MKFTHHRICNETSHGSQCSLECLPGFISPHSLSFVCTNGDWEQISGVAINDNTCQDYDACTGQISCNLRVSDCQDLPPPSMEYECVCKQGFSGEPGPKGNGCVRTSILTQNGNIELRTGAEKEIIFIMGEESMTVTGLKDSVQEETLRAQSVENTLQDSITALQQDIDNNKNILEDALEETVNAAMDQLQQNNEESFSQVRDEIQTTKTSLSIEIDATNSKVENVQDILLENVGSLEVNIESSVAAAKTELKSKIQDVSQELDIAISDKLAALSELRGEITLLNSNIQSESQRAQIEEQSLADNFATLQQFVFDLAESHDDLSGDHGDHTSLTDLLQKELSAEVKRANSREANLQQAINNLQEQLQATNNQFNNYFTRNQVQNQLQNLEESVQDWVSLNYYDRETSNDRFPTKNFINNNFFTRTQTSNTFLTQSSASNTYLSKSEATSTYATQGFVSNNFFTRQQSDSRFYTRTAADNRFYTKTQLDESMTYPITSGLIRRLPLLASSWVSTNSPVRFFTTEPWSIYPTVPSGQAAILIQWLYVPPGWRVRGVLVAASSSVVIQLRVRPVQATSGTLSMLCSGSANTLHNCVNNGFQSPTHVYLAVLTNIFQIDDVFGGYYDIIKV
eukprot:gene122-3515_t